jgi:hypothetical protein
MLTVTLLLVLVAFLCTIGSALGKCPSWVPVLLLCVIHLIEVLPR